jgi:hypothetical protein
MRRRDVAYWPEADVQQAPENVCLLGKSRHQSKKASLRLLDPKATSGCADAGQGFPRGWVTPAFEAALACKGHYHIPCNSWSGRLFNAAANNPI